MKLLNKNFMGSNFKPIICAVILTCVALTGCSKDNSQPIKTSSKSQESNTKQHFVKIENKFDARLGVFALNTANNKTITYRADERFGFASTSKVLAVGTLLKQKSLTDLNQKVNYTQNDLVNYNPITEKHVDKGMTLKELSDAALRYSDNTAMNLILKQIEGPSGLEKALRDIGDNVTNPARFEPELNEVKPGETQDTTTPRALATNLQSFVLGDILPTDKRELLTNWMKKNTTGDTLIRAGVPKGWVVADKTGSGSYGIRNDIAVIWPPEGDPIVLAILSSRDKKDASSNDKLIAEATKEVIKTYKANH